MSKIRLLYNNIADTATITSPGTATGYPTTNMQTDLKGQVWRSSGKSITTITLAWNTDQTINSVFLPYTNLTPTATIRFVLKNSLSNILVDSGTNTIQTIANQNTKLNLNQYSFGMGTSLRYYPTSQTTVRSLEITIVDSNNPQNFMEIGRIVCGQYLQLDYNVSFGLSVDIINNSTNLRTEAGNLIVQPGITYKSINFNLDYMSVGDRDTLFQLFKQFGINTPVMVSIFPEDLDLGKEIIHEIYGKFTGQFNLQHPLYSQYVTSLTIEEI